MDSSKRKIKVAYELENVIVTSVGPLKDEAPFEGKLMIVEDEYHGIDVEWHPMKVKTSDIQNSPELEHLDWEEISSTVGYKASHNDSIDAVEIKAIRMPNVIKFEMYDLKSYKRKDSSNGEKTLITFLLKDGTNIPTLQFNSRDWGKFCAALDNYVNFKKSKRESNLYLLVDPKAEALEKSFSELDIFSDSKTHIISKIMNDPVHTALAGFSNVTNFLYEQLVSNNVNETSFTGMYNDFSEVINNIVPNVDFNNHEEPGFEMITCIDLPERPTVSREDPVNQEEWADLLDLEGRLKDVVYFKKRVFKGGLAHNIRPEAWKYLLGYYDFEATSKELAIYRESKSEEYFSMKLQWKCFTDDQISRFSAFKDRKSLIEKDVSRTDRTHPFFEGENNPNIQMLQDILMTYCMYNFDLGYVQGMSDLLSPILVIMQDEVDAFWCFAYWLQNIGSNFELEQQGMKNQLQDLHRLLHFVDPILCEYLEKHDSGNLYFAFRWLLILFKRDFKFLEIMRLWEVLWTSLPCKNFHLLLCLAILDSEKLIIMENNYGLTEILKHVNEMSYKINLNATLSKAEAIFLQIKNSKYRSDIVETILGLEHIKLEPSPARLSPQLSVESKNESAAADDSPVNSERSDYEHLNPPLFDLPY